MLRSLCFWAFRPSVERKHWTGDPTNNPHCLGSEDRQVQGTQQDVINLQARTAVVQADTYTGTLEVSFCFQSVEPPISSSYVLKQYTNVYNFQTEFDTGPQASTWVQSSLLILMTGVHLVYVDIGTSIPDRQASTRVIDYYLWNRSVWSRGVFPMSACRAVSCCLWRDSLS